MHVLHITAWYPNSARTQEGIFIERHVNTLLPHCTNTVWQIEARHSKKWSLVRKGNANRTLVVNMPISAASFIEYVSFIMILWCWLSRSRTNRFDLINICVAYPNAVYIKYLRRIFGLPLVITEHHSAYHFSFGSSSSGLERTKRIFRADIPVITVSESLASDIKDFSGNKNLDYSVIDNVVDTSLFRYDAKQTRSSNTFFSVAGWKAPKRPDLLIKAMSKVNGEEGSFKLRIGGDGSLLDDLKSQIDELGLSESIVLLGRLEAEEVALEMQRATAFILPTDYETFSVVCAESLCCGTPVIASAVGGIPGFVNDKNGMLVTSDSEKDWRSALKAMLVHNSNFDHQSISENANVRFNPINVGNRYFERLSEILNSERKA